MKKLIHIILSCVLFFSCTASRWEVENKNAIDPKSGRVQDSQIAITFNKFTTSGKNVIAEFNISEVNSTLYDQKIQSRIYIQQYSPRWTMFLLGFGASGLLFYMGNSIDHGSADANSNASLTYNILGGAVFIGTLYNQKPVGSPRKTEEVKFLTKTGEILKSDTVKIISGNQGNILANIYFKDQLWMRSKSFTIKDNSIKIPVFDHISIPFVKANTTDEAIFDMEYKGKVYEFFIPLKAFMSPYVSTTKVTSISSRASTKRSDQITQIPRKSIYNMIDDKLGEWFVVKFGATSAYLPKKSSEIIWARPGLEVNAFVTDNLAVISNELDIESNIPLETRRPKSPRALLVSNKMDSDANSGDDIRALKAYLIQTFGYEDNEIITKTAISKAEILQQLRRFGDEGVHGEITLFYAGSITNDEKPSIRIQSEGRIEELSFDDFYKGLIDARGLNYRVYFDLGMGYKSINQSAYRTKLRASTSKFLQGMDKSLVWFSSFPGQESATYSVELSTLSNHYSAFMFYLLQGVKKGIYQTADLKQFVDKELNFTSRKLYDRSQETQLFQNSSIHLVK